VVIAMLVAIGGRSSPKKGRDAALVAWRRNRGVRVIRLNGAALLPADADRACGSARWRDAGW